MTNQHCWHIDAENETIMTCPPMYAITCCFCGDHAHNVAREGQLIAPDSCAKRPDCGFEHADGGHGGRRSDATRWGNFA